MPTQQLPRELLEACVREVAKARADGFQPGGMPSDRQEAARRLGIHPRTFDNRLQIAKARFGLDPENVQPPKDPSPVKLPEFPDNDIPTEEIIETLKKRFEKRKERADAEKWWPVKIKDEGPFAICHWGDVHLDSPGCDWPTLEKHVRLVAETPHVYGLNIGDTVDNWPQSGRLLKLYAQSDNSEETAWKLAKWFLVDSGITWVVWLLGNHDLWNQGKYVLKYMNSGVGVPMFDWGSQFVLKCGKREWRIWASHDFPGHSMWNTLHGPQKAAHIKERADLYICGHKHNWALHQEESGSRDFTYWLARARGYKYLDDYSSKLGHFPQERGSSIISVHDTVTGSLTCFPDVEEGLDYLQFKRSKAGCE